jgi:hypothetical protein
MKRLFSLGLICLLSIFLVSWGSLGHRTVGLIASRHLTPKAQAAVKDLLGTATLEEVSTWADDVRNDPQYKSTGPWHYINLPLGLSRQQFDATVLSMNKANVYSALQESESTLINPYASKVDKEKALKFIVHFVGDLHQPMHVSRAEDQGGNKLQVNYESKGTNLHALWDSRLLEHEGLSDQQLAGKIDHATPQQIQQWQSDPLLQWLWESYQISTRLYSEVQAMKNRTITEDYYHAHLPVIEDRLEQAGIRLAGVLNTLFKGGPVKSNPRPASPQQTTPWQSNAPQEIDVRSAPQHLGEDVLVCAQVFGQKTFSTMTLVNLGADYPNQLLTVVLKEEAKQVYPDLDGKNVCVSGKLENYKGKPQIIVTDPKMIHLVH